MAGKLGGKEDKWQVIGVIQQGPFPEREEGQAVVIEEPENREETHGRKRDNPWRHKPQV